MRWHVSTLFSSAIKEHLPEISSVGIVGGSSRDAEAQAIKLLKPEIQIHSLGIDQEVDTDSFFDIDINYEIANRDIPAFDLIICSQVLEHIWDHEKFFTNLNELLRQGGHLWLGCPASNMAHGSPSYFAAGFTSTYLQNNLEKHGFEILSKGSLGSHRYYIATHFGHEWLSEREHSNPIIKFDFKQGTLKGKLNRFRRLLPRRFLYLLFSSEISESLDFATESWVLSKKI